MLCLCISSALPSSPFVEIQKSEVVERRRDVSMGFALAVHRLFHFTTLFVHDERMRHMVSKDRSKHLQGLLVHLQRFVQLTYFLMYKSEVAERRCDVRMRLPVSMEPLLHFQTLCELRSCPVEVSCVHECSPSEWCLHAISRFTSSR